MKKNLKNTFLLAVMMCLTFFYSFAIAEPVYKIGGVFSYTGRASSYGIAEKNTMEMMIEQINAAGGIDGRMLEAVIYDSEGDPAKAVSAVNKLLHIDKVLAIIGPSTTPTTLAIVNFVERSQVPLISCANDVTISSPTKPWVFTTAPSDLLTVAAIYQHMQAKGIKKIGILTVANSFGESGKNQMLSQAEKYGLEVIQAESFGAKDTDTTAQLTKIKSASPDAIVCWGLIPESTLITTQVKQLGIDIPLYLSPLVASQEFIQLAGNAAEKILLPTEKYLIADLLPEDDFQKEIIDTYEADYNAKWNENISCFGGYAFDAVNLLANALKDSEGDKKLIRSSLESIQNYTGVTGIFNFSDTEHNGLSSDAFVIAEINNGAFVIPSPHSIEDSQIDSDKFFNWAEVNFPQFFSPSGAETIYVEPYSFRYYSDTDIYIGIVEQEVYLYGNDFGGLLSIGKTSNFIQ